MLKNGVLKMKNEEQIKKDIETTFGELVKVHIKRRHRIKVDAPKNMTLPILAYLKQRGFHQFTLLTCVDWIKKGTFELVYNLYSLDYNIHVLVSTHINRENESMPTAINIYEMAFDYEREIHEMFGVEFEGHPRLGEFLLEDWKGMPPMRKDFDTRAYVEEKFNVKDLTKELFTRKEQPYRGPGSNG